jgi:ubiquinone/menaquinone biosynthesis C-methylase UbiE
MKTGNFGKVREAYASARQLFPVEVIRYIWSKTTAGTPHILDLGCGTGIATRQLYERGAKIIGSDIDSAMIKEAQETSPDEVSYVVAPAHDLPFQTSKFDAITTFSAFHWFKNDNSLAEIKRVLKGGGRFFVINKNDVAGFRTGYREKLEHLLGRPLPSMKDKYDPANILREAGFSDICTETFSGKEHFSLPKALQHIQSAAVWNEIPSETKTEAMELMRDHIDENAENGEAIREVNVVVVSGIIA